MTTVEKKFQTNMIDFMDELIELFPHAADLTTVRMVLPSICPVAIIETFMVEIYPKKVMIVNRDASFFTEFSIPGMSIDRLLKIWNSDTLDDEDRAIIWSWFDAFIHLVEEYKKMKNTKKE